MLADYLIKRCLALVYCRLADHTQHQEGSIRLSLVLATRRLSLVNVKKSSPSNGRTELSYVCPNSSSVSRLSAPPTHGSGAFCDSVYSERASYGKYSACPRRYQPPRHWLLLSIYPQHSLSPFTLPYSLPTLSPLVHIPSSTPQLIFDYSHHLFQLRIIRPFANPNHKYFIEPHFSSS